MLDSGIEGVVRWTGALDWVLIYCEGISSFAEPELLPPQSLRTAIAIQREGSPSYRNISYT